MKERPIIFSGPMVRAILEGRKTQTRRPIRWPVHSFSDGAKRRVFCPDDAGAINELLAAKHRHPCRRVACPYGQPGDRLWVKESHWRFTGCTERGNRPWTGFVESPDGNPYKAICYDDSEVLAAANIHAACYRVPSIHMPRWASRITLEVVEVRVERVAVIDSSDARAEGFSGGPRESETDAFHNAWDTIYAKKGLGWDFNPWVWVVSFKRVVP